jgi:hypothetical protein
VLMTSKLYMMSRAHCFLAAFEQLHDGFGYEG